MKTNTEGSRWIIHSAGGILRRLPEGERWVAEDQVQAFRKHWEELSEFMKTKDPDYNFRNLLMMSYLLFFQIRRQRTIFILTPRNNETACSMP